jgi:hypothetical protein
MRADHTLGLCFTIFFCAGMTVERLEGDWIYPDSLKSPEMCGPLRPPGVRVSSARAYLIPDDGIATSL